MGRTIEFFADFFAEHARYADPLHGNHRGCELWRCTAASPWSVDTGDFLGHSIRCPRRPGGSQCRPDASFSTNGSSSGDTFNFTSSTRSSQGRKFQNWNAYCAYRLLAGLLCFAATSWLLIPVPPLLKVGSFLISSLVSRVAASLGNCSLHPIVTAVCVIQSHLISSHIFSPFLSSFQLITTVLISLHVNVTRAVLISSQLIWVPLFSAYLSSSILRSSSQLSSSWLFSCQLVSALHRSSHVSSSQLSSSQLFTALLMSARLNSSHLISAYISSSQIFLALFTTLLSSSQLTSAHLKSSHLFSPLLTSSKLFLALLTSSQLISALVTSSQLILRSSQPFSGPQPAPTPDLGATATKSTIPERIKIIKHSSSKLWRNQSNAICKQKVARDHGTTWATATQSNVDAATPMQFESTRLQKPMDLRWQDSSFSKPKPAPKPDLGAKAKK